MRLALALGHVTSAADAKRRVDQARRAEDLCYDSVWASEAYGSDAVTLLAHVGALTRRIGLGSAVLQIPARTPAMTAMTAATLDVLSGRRFRLGLGVSGPQVSEGWHGVAFDAPLARTREYVGLVRQALRREPLSGDGPHYPVPPAGRRGRSLRLSLHPERADLSILLAAVGPRSLRLAGEVADGWLASFFSVEDASRHLDVLAEGRRRSGLDLSGFDVLVNTPVVVGDDLASCADQVRDHVALYVGGMGSREKNFYNHLVRDMGFDQAASTVQDLYLAGDKSAAAAALPFELLDRVSLLGPVERIAERMQALAGCGVTTLAVGSTGGHELTAATLVQVAAAYEKAAVA